MTVAELQFLLSNLAKFLRASEGAKVAAELEHLCERLIPFEAFKLRAMGDFPVQAEAYSRGELLPKPGRQARRPSALRTGH